MVTNYEYGSKIIGEGDTEVDGENEKEVVEVNTAETRREIKNNSKIIATTNRIGKYKIVKDILQKKIKKRKRINETILNNGNVWKKAGKRTKCERKNNTEYNKEKDSRTSSTKLCRIISKNIIIPSDDPT